jgi:hypothetical protein
MNLFDKVKIAEILTKLYWRFDMTANWKTTAASILAAVGTILPYFKVPADVCHAITVLGLFLIGLFAKDAGVSGTGTVANPYTKK